MKTLRPGLFIHLFLQGYPAVSGGEREVPDWAVTCRCPQYGTQGSTAAEAERAG